MTIVIHAVFYKILEALRQGYKGKGWSSAACQNAKEFIDIKKQLEENIK